MLSFTPDTLRNLSEETILDLRVMARKRGEKIAVWQPQNEHLVVLFDGKRGYEWADYMWGDCYPVAPGAYFICDRHVRSNTHADVAGVLIENADNYLSHFYHAHWQELYQTEAKLFNQDKTPVRLVEFWRYYAVMVFKLCDDTEDLRKVRMIFRNYGDEIMTAGLRDISVHIPLIPDRHQLLAIN